MQTKSTIDKLTVPTNVVDVPTGYTTVYSTLLLIFLREKNLTFHTTAGIV